MVQPAPPLALRMTFATCSLWSLLAPISRQIHPSPVAVVAASAQFGLRFPRVSQSTRQNAHALVAHRHDRWNPTLRRKIRIRICSDTCVGRGHPPPPWGEDSPSRPASPLPVYGLPLIEGFKTRAIKAQQFVLCSDPEIAVFRLRQGMAGKGI